MKDTTLTFRLSEHEKAQLVAIAREKDVPFSQLMREMMREYLLKNQKEEKKNG